MTMVPLLDTDGNPLTIRRGTSPTLQFEVHERTFGFPPKSLVGATEITFMIAARRSATVVDLMVTLGDGVSHDGTGGVVTVELTSAQTESLSAPGGKSTRWVELWITDIDGKRDLAGAGVCIVYDTLYVPGITSP